MKRTGNLRAQVLDELGTRIMANDMPPGSQFAPEGQLAEEMGVSRTVAREAMKGLAARGMVSAKPRSGTRVTPRSEWQLFDADVMRWRLDRPDNLDDLKQLLELRLLLEPPAARMTAERGDPDLRAAVWTAYEDIVAARDDPHRWIEAAARLHAGIFAGCGNEFIANFAGALRCAILYSRNRTRPALDTLPDDAATDGYASAVEEGLGRYGALASAIRDGDGPSAEAACRRLLERVGDLFDYLGGMS